MNSDVWPLATFDDGSGGGPALYAGGLFTTAGGATASHVARWNGTEWSKVATPLDDQTGVILEAVTNVPGTKRVYAAGYIENGFGVPDDVLITRIC